VDFALEIRTYQTENPDHQHDFAQLVLPVHGRMEIDVDGCGGYVDHSLAALVSPGSTHSQMTQRDSRFLILDCPAAVLENMQMAQLSRRIYVPIPPATRRLIEFAELTGNDQLAVSAAQLAPLLLASLSAQPALLAGGMDRLLTRMRACPGASWSNEAMALAAAMSMSQLHQRFRQLFDQTPQAWLAELRMQEAQRWLRDSGLPIADIALRCGFSDQAALTRAMQRLCSTTPAVYRRLSQQPR
jgi:AraC-like DNA-binding protein